MKTKVWGIFITQCVKKFDEKKETDAWGKSILSGALCNMKLSHFIFFKFQLIKNLSNHCLKPNFSIFQKLFLYFSKFWFVIMNLMDALLAGLIVAEVSFIGGMVNFI